MKYQIITINKNLRKILKLLFKSNGERLVLKYSDKNPLVYHKKTEQITYISKGEGIAILDNQKINIYEGQVIIIPKKTQHSFKSITSSLVTYHIHWPKDYLDTDRYIKKDNVIL